MTTKTITFEEVEERLKHKKMEDWTDADVFDRYIRIPEMMTNRMTLKCKDY